MTIEATETARIVAAAIAELPERQRAALVLSYYEGLSNAECATVLDATVAGVEALLVRARRALRVTLQSQIAR
jgi:RNA polymerase sigma-70 factor (ECF subfamily)